MTSRCPQCPTPEIECIAIRTNQPNFCRFVTEGHGEYVASLSRGKPSKPRYLANLRVLQARRASCPHLGPKCSTGCAGDVHVCLAGKSNWPGQPDKAGRNECLACPLLPAAPK